jgi:hypothetical protein
VDTRIKFVVAVVSLIVLAAATYAASTAPLAGEWNIRPTGTAASNGELVFRMTPGDEAQDPVEVTVSVRSGSSDVAVARDIRQALSAQLRRDRFNVRLGEGANVLVSDQHGRPNFSLELLDSDIDDLRVAVQPVEPAASPTVPAQAVPATAPAPGTPPSPGDATPPPQRDQPQTTPPDAAPGTTPPPRAPAPTPEGTPSTTPEATPAPGPGQPATSPPMGAPTPPG